MPNLEYFSTLQREILQAHPSQDTELIASLAFCDRTPPFPTQLSAAAKFVGACLLEAATEPDIRVLRRTVEPRTYTSRGHLPKDEELVRGWVLTKEHLPGSQDPFMPPSMKVSLLRSSPGRLNKNTVIVLEAQYILPLSGNMYAPWLQGENPFWLASKRPPRWLGKVQSRDPTPKLHTRESPASASTLKQLTLQIVRLATKHGIDFNSPSASGGR